MKIKFQIIFTQELSGILYSIITITLVLIHIEQKSHKIDTTLNGPHWRIVNGSLKILNEKRSIRKRYHFTAAHPTRLIKYSVVLRVLVCLPRCRRTI